MDIPKFLIADDGEDREFVVHCHYPRFLAELTTNRLDVVEWFDSERDYIVNEQNAGREPAQSLATLMRELGDWFQSLE